MPGVTLHVVAGSIVFLIGRYYFKSYFDGNSKEKMLLVFVCLLFSCLPDFFLAVYYTTHLLPFEMLLHYHIFTHIIFTPAAVIGLLLLKYVVDVERKPIWIMGLWCIVLHIVMDIFIPENGVWI
ncbi:MAG TPA: hypothetical protein ENI42_01540 [Thermoplasmatales archaeon]|nr:hypothetical protein [Thermoplasmatales archaeon]